ncbi:MAG: 3-oxoacyl-ACP synthase, partial [Myxococcales bacterium]|nr:3-oxoacyl-ACP synthase [Myxococcales bacterium]
PFIPQDADGNGIVNPELMWAHMEGRKVFKNAVQRMAESLMRVFAAENLTRDDVDLFVFHQANLRINQYLAKEVLGIPEEKLVNNIMRYGNTTAATIPILLAESERNGKLKRGMKVAMAAFGSGFTWGAAVVDW